MSRNTIQPGPGKVRWVPNRPPPVYFTTYDAARPLHVTPDGVRHLVDIGQIPATRTRSGRRLMLKSAILALAASRAAAALELVPHVVHHPERRPATPQQLPLFHVRPAKVALDVRRAKGSRVRRKSFGVR